MATTTTRFTFEDFEKLPDDGRRHELRHGELFELPPPVHGHKLVQLRLRRLLEKAGGSSGEIDSEVGFRPVPDAYLIADIAYVVRARWDNVPVDGYLVGAPEMVVEVLSPSNSMAEMRDKRKMCLENGGREFWIVDPKQREVEVSTPDGHSVVYKSTQQIPLFFNPGATIPVGAIFE